MKANIYETITAQIVTAIEEGAGLYRMPWHRARSDVTNPVNVTSGRAYRGLNVIMLGMIGDARGYESGTWATYQQWQEKGAQVRKGEKCAPVFFWKNLDVPAGETDAAPERDGGARFVARGYSVFNADQVDGYTAPAVPALPEKQRIAAVEAFFAAVPATITPDGARACYLPSLDRIEMVPFGQFKDAKSYYSVLAHELTHWTGAKHRLDRTLSGRFGSDAYAAEELIAELGAAFIGGRLGLPSVPRTDHAPYMASWLKVLKNDSRAVFTAAAKAQAAADYLAGFSNEA